MDYHIVEFFVSAGEPVTSLTPAITIYDINNSGTPVIDAKAMHEIGLGIYDYDFTEALGYKLGDHYAVYIDGGNGISADTDRYHHREIKCLEGAGITAEGVNFRQKYD
jgi:hypothetical protein